MRFLLFAILASLSVFLLSAEHYYYKGERIPLTAVSDQYSKLVFLSSDSTFPSAELQSQQTQVSKPVVEVEIVKDSHSVAIPGNASLSTDDSSFTICLPALAIPSGEICYQNNYLYVKLKDESDTDILNAAVEKYHLALIQQNEFMPQWFSISITAETGLSALEVANRLYESGEFECVEPELIPENIPLSNDSYYDKQWNIKPYDYIMGGTPPYLYRYMNYGSGLENVWDEVTGKGVKVAVIDSGVSTDVEDLSPNLLSTGYNAFNRMPSTCQPDEFYEYTDDYFVHGTRCASIIASVRDNGIGIAGAAPDSKIIPIIINYYSTATFHEDIANAINWA